MLVMCKTSGLDEHQTRAMGGAVTPGESILLRRLTKQWC